MIENVNYSELLLLKIKKKKGDFKFLLSNLRMSICELG